MNIIRSMDKKTRRYVQIIATAAAAVILAITVVMYGSLTRHLPTGSTATEITQADEKSDDEIRDELNRQVEESRMTISVASSVRLSQNRARVNVVNPSTNTFNQRFTLMQDSNVIYESDVIKPGEKLEWCEAEGLHEGDATIAFQAIDPNTGKESGNPQAVTVNVTNADDSQS